MRSKQQPFEPLNNMSYVVIQDEVGRREMYAAMCRQKIRHRQFLGQNFECLKDNLMKRY